VPNLDYFFRFLNIDDDINYVLSGYFSKIAGSFFEGDTLSMILEYCYEEDRHIENLTKHIYCKSLAILLSKLLNFEAPEAPICSPDSSNLNDVFASGGEFDFGATISDSTKFSNMLSGDGDDDKLDDIEEDFGDDKKNKGKSEAQEKLDNLMDGIFEKRIKIFKNLVNNLLASTDLEVISNTQFIFSEFFENNKIDHFKELFIELFMTAENLETIFKCLQLRTERSGSKAKVAIITTIFCSALDIISKTGQDSIDVSEHMGKKIFK